MLNKTYLKNTISAMLLVLMIVIAFFPSIVNAQGFVPCEGSGCSACHFVQMANSILVWLIGVMFAIFAVILAIAGFGLVTSGGNPAAKQAAKDKMMNAVIGLIIVLAAWLLVDTIMKALLAETGGKINGTLWTEIECTDQTPLRPSVPVTPSGSPSPTGSGLTEADVLSSFSDAGVSVVSSGSCTNPLNATCTGLAGMQQSTVDGVVAVSEACPSCNIVVTAGTEIGHTNECHVNGTCADIDCRSGASACSVEQINTIDTTASSLGLNAVYEVKTTARKNELVEAGVDPGAISVVSWITGEHFSLYTTSQ